MSPDDLDSFIVSLADWIDTRSALIEIQTMEDDGLYSSLTDLVYNELDRFCTRDRNYN